MLSPSVSTISLPLYLLFLSPSSIFSFPPVVSLSLSPRPGNRIVPGTAWARPMLGTDIHNYGRVVPLARHARSGTGAGMVRRVLVRA